MRKKEVDYREIPLSRGQVAIVDEVEYKSIAKSKWSAAWSRKTKTFYAVRTVYLGMVNGKRSQYVVYMHRQVMGLSRGDGIVADHIRAGKTLDNRRNNLRIADRFGNARNRKEKMIEGKLKGACYDAHAKKWKASICFHGKQIHIGLFARQDEAHAAYCKVALRLHGEFASF